MSKVRDGVTVKIRRDVHRELTKLVGNCMSTLGVKVTYSDVIEALIKNVQDPVNAVKKYIESRER